MFSFKWIPFAVTSWDHFHCFCVSIQKEIANTQYSIIAVLGIIKNVMIKVLQIRTQWIN